MNTHKPHVAICTMLANADPIAPARTAPVYAAVKAMALQAGYGIGAAERIGARAWEAELDDSYRIQAKRAQLAGGR